LTLHDIKNPLKAPAFNKLVFRLSHSNTQFNKAHVALEGLRAVK
jgi:hypothetical protein